MAQSLCILTHNAGNKTAATAFWFYALTFHVNHLLGKQFTPICQTLLFLKKKC